LQSLKERTHLEDLSIDGRITALKERGCESVDWMYVAQDRDPCQALVSKIMNLWVP
jgi:hypothetical protein